MYDSLTSSIIEPIADHKDVYETVIQSIDVAHRRRVHRLLGVVFVILGYVLFAHGLMALGVHLPHPMLPHYQPLGGAMGH